MNSVVSLTSIGRGCFRSLNHKRSIEGAPTEADAPLACLVVKDASIGGVDAVAPAEGLNDGLLLAKQRPIDALLRLVNCAVFIAGHEVRSRKYGKVTPLRMHPNLPPGTRRHQFQDVASISQGYAVPDCFD